MNSYQLDLFEKDIYSEVKSTKEWMGRLQKKVLRLERSLEALNIIRNQKEPESTQLKLWQSV